MKSCLSLLLALAFMLPAGAADSFRRRLLMAQGGVPATPAACGTLQQEDGETYNGTAEFLLGDYVACRFTTGGAGFTVCSVDVRLDNLSGNAETLQVAIYSNTGDEPDALVGTASDTRPSGDVTGDAFYSFTNMSATLSASTTYWLVLIASDTDVDVAIPFDNSGESPKDIMYSSDNGATWTDQEANSVFNFRIYGSTESFSPDDVTGLVFWLDVDGLSGSDGDAIQTFPDATANNHDFSHATSGNRPILTNSTSVLNNKKSLWFDGSNDYYTNKTYALAASDYTFYAVFKLKSAFNDGNIDYLLDDVSGTQELSIQLVNPNTFTIRVSDGANDNNFGLINDTEARVISVVMNSTGTALTCYTNGISAGSAGTFAQPAQPNYLTLGAAQNFSTGFHFGIVADTLLYTGAHNDTDRHNIEDYLGTKFGITINH